MWLWCGAYVLVFHNVLCFAVTDGALICNQVSFVFRVMENVKLE